MSMKEETIQSVPKSTELKEEKKILKISKEELIKMKKKEGESIRKGEWIMNLFGRKIISDGEEYDKS